MPSHQRPTRARPHLTPPRWLATLAVAGGLLALPGASLAATTVGNGVYRVTVEADPLGVDCGTWTAQTGPLHEAGAGLNVFFGDGAPGTSDTTLRSWSSGMTWRTGSPLGCAAACSEDAPMTSLVRRDGVDVGVLMAWTFVDPGGSTVQLVQEVVVEGPVDGTEDVDDTVIRETHFVENVGSEELAFGLRKLWDWQVGRDDGPWFGECDAPEAACDRSFSMTAEGETDAGPMPAAYVINSDPLVASCPGSLEPLDPLACGGGPPYVVAGTVRPPSDLDPAPTPPDRLDFNSWESMFFTCFDAPLRDAASCSSFPDDTATAYFYGADPASAIVLAPGEGRAFTQYVAAASDDCPDVVEPPTVTCDAGSPVTAGCDGDSIPLDGEGSSSDPSAELSFRWTTDCPGVFDDPDRADPVLMLDPSCPLSCEATLEVSDGPSSASCSVNVDVGAMEPLTLEAPDDAVVECPAPASGPGSEATWLASASASGGCLGADVEAVELSRELGCGSTVTATWELRAVDGCGGATDPVVRTWRTVDTTPPTVLENRLDGACAWPPRHDRICLGAAGGHVLAEDDCGETSARWVGCESDQPDEAPEPGSPDNGDGHFFDDCLVAVDGSDACVRVERAGTDPEGRHYLASISVTDECGNEVIVPSTFLVPHDRRGDRPPCRRGQGGR